MSEKLKNVLVTDEMDANTTCLCVHISNITLTFTNVLYTFNITHSDRSPILERSAVQSNITS